MSRRNIRISPTLLVLGHTLRLATDTVYEHSEARRTQRGCTSSSRHQMSNLQLHLVWPAKLPRTLRPSFSAMMGSLASGAQRPKNWYRSHAKRIRPTAQARMWTLGLYMDSLSATSGSINPDQHSSATQLILCLRREKESTSLCGTQSC